MVSRQLSQVLISDLETFGLGSGLEVPGITDPVNNASVNDQYFNNTNFFLNVSIGGILRSRLRLVTSRVTF